MKKKVLISLLFVIMLIVINYINDNSSATKTISYNGNNLRISIDGEVSSTLPTSGNYYLVDYDCKSSNTKVEWIKYTDDNNEVQYKLNVSNGTKKSGVICNLEFKSNPLLSEMPVGSYVAYTGDNNCDNTNVNGWTSCMGKNANYVSDTDMGYCSNNSFDFTVNGWRLAYVEDGSPHLISAGATDCMCTSSTGRSSSGGCSGSLTSTNLYMHFNNMNNIALKYCNKNYAKGGICTSITTYDEKNNPVDKDNATAWAMLADIKTEDDPRETSDFKKITGSDLSSSSCYASNNVSNRFACGYTNDLIDNGGYYWIATPYSTSNYAFYWYPNYRYVNANNYGSNYLFGVRPVLALESSIRVMDGDGTYSNPYIINNDYFEINNGAKYISTNDNISQVQLSLNSSSETTKMCISVNTSVCTNYISYSDTYTLDWSSEADGEKVVYVYFKDSNDEIVASMNRSITIDTTVPTNNSVSITSGSGVYATVALASTGADYMCLSDTSNSASDCTKWIDYTTSYNWIFSEGTGTKNLYAFFKDKAGNISSVVSDSMTCSSNCYKYFMDSYNNSYIYLMRSDGATALTTTSATNITWYSEGSQSMNVCGAYNYSSNGRIWCIGNDNNAYYKTSYSATSWSKVNISSYIDTNNYTYSIYPYGTTGAYIVRNDGKTNLISTSTKGLESTSWSYGDATDMATCSGYSSSSVICLGVDGNYYYKTSYSSTNAYTNRSFVKLTNRTNTNSWIDMYYNSYTNIIESDGNNLYNTRFSYSTSTTPTWYTTTIPGNGIKTCTSSGYSTYNYCLGYDGYLYYKTYSATSWRKSSLSVS